LLNEAEDEVIASIPENASPSVVVRIAHIFSWFFDMLEPEINTDFQWNYLKVTFVNLKSLAGVDEREGQMSTNVPELPPPIDQPPHLMIHQIITTMRTFFSHLRGSVEIADWVYNCDWVSMTWSKSS